MNNGDERGDERSRSREEGLSTAELAGAGTSREQQYSQEQERADDGQQPAALFPAEEADELHRRWDAVQAGFVDEPRRAVEEADSLVASAMKRLAETFADERANLERQWDRGDDVSTEDLRVALQRYRAFFARLLSM